MSQTPESQLLRAVCEYLSYRGFVFWRQNNTGVYDPVAKRYRSMPIFSVKGVADIQVIVNGKSWFLELKSETGRQSNDQKDFEVMVTRAGAEYHLIRSIDDLQRLGF